LRKGRPPLKSAVVRSIFSSPDFEKSVALARTRSKEYDSIQELILERTAELFASRGYVASSIGDIAEACECSKSRLYHYFDSKESILSTMLTEHVDRLIHGGREIVAAHADPRERFTRLIQFFMEIYAVSRAKQVVLLTCIEFLPEGKRREIIDKERELVSYVRNILKALQPGGAQAGSATDVDTMLFFGMINWTYTWYRADGAITPQELAERSVSMFLNGYLASGDAAPDKAASGKAASGVKTLVSQ
jgi:AcrR family transcriptional regulator